MKGIVLAGGTGSRLHPLTLATSKQLLPVYDKPMIYYPISTLMLAGIREILIITTVHESTQFKRLLGDGSQWGVNLEYSTQDKPNGIAESLIIGEDFIGDGSVALVLGDNIFHGSGMGRQLQGISNKGATVFACESHNPQAYGVIEFGEYGEVIGIKEKPIKPASSMVVTGLYFFDNRASQYARELKPSNRGELEITDLNNRYLVQGELSVRVLKKGTQWFDTGNFESLLTASQFVRDVEHSSGRRIAVPEEIAWRPGIIADGQLRQAAQKYPNSEYGKYLLRVLKTVSE